MLQDIHSSKTNYFNERILGFLLAITFPIVSILNSFRISNYSFFKNILWLNCIFYAYSLDFHDPLYDLNRYHLFFQEISFYNVSSIKEFIEIAKYIDIDLDYYQTYSSLIISQFTKNSHIYFAFLGIIYGYFYSRNIDMILKKLNINLNSLSSLLFIVVIINFIGFSGMAGFRFWTAAHIYLFFILRYFLYNKKYWYIFFAPLVHIALIIPIIVFAIYLIKPKVFTKLIFLKISIILMMFAGILPLSVIRDTLISIVQISVSPGLVRRLELYTEGDFLDLQKGISNVGLFFLICKKFLLILSFILLYIYRKKITNEMKNIFYFNFFLLSFISFLSVLPIFSRFYDIPLFIAIVLVIWINKVYRMNFYLITMFSLLILFNLIDTVVKGRVFYTVDIFYTPFILLNNIFQ